MHSLHLRFTTILQDGCIVSHILQMETCGLGEVTWPENSSTQTQAQPCLTPKPSFSHTPPPLTMTQSYPCPLPCDWQGDPSPSELAHSASHLLWAECSCCTSGCTTSPSWGGRDESSLPSFRQDEGSLCLQKMPPPRAWLGLAGPHLKAPMTTPDSSLKGGAPGLQSGPRWAGTGR